MADLADNMLMAATATAITGTLISWSLINLTATRLAWTNKSLTSNDIENAAKNDVYSIGFMSLFTLIVHVAPLILIFTSVYSVSAGFGLTSAAFKRYTLLMAIYWCKVLPGPFNWINKVRDMYTMSKTPGGFFMDMQTKAEYGLTKNANASFLGLSNAINALSVVATLFVMISYQQFYVNGWNFDNTSVAASCVLSSGMMLFFTLMLQWSTAAYPLIEKLYAKRGLKVTVGVDETEVKTAIPVTGINSKLKPTDVLHLAEILSAKQGNQRLMKDLAANHELGDQHQLIGVPLTYNKCSAVGQPIAVLQSTIVDCGDNPESSMGVSKFDFATRTFKHGTEKNSIKLFSQKSVAHLDNLIGGSVAEFGKLPSLYRCREIKTQIGGDVAFKKSETANEFNTGKTRTVRKASKQEQSENERFRVKEFDRTPSLSYDFNKVVFCYFMYDVGGFGIGWGTYLYMSALWIAAYCLFTVPFWIGVMLDVQDGVTMAFAFVTVPMLLAYMGRKGQFWELECFGYMIGVFILFSGRAFGFSESILGPFSDASWNRNNLDDLTTAHNIDANPTYLTLAIASVVCSSVIFFHALIVRTGCFTWAAHGIYGYVVKAGETSFSGDFDARDSNPASVFNLKNVDGKRMRKITMPGQIVTAEKTGVKVTPLPFLDDINSERS